MSGKFSFEIEQQRFDEQRLSAEPKLELVGWVSDKAVRLLALGANVHADIYTCEAPGRIPLYAAPPAVAPNKNIEALRRDAGRYWWLLNWLVKTGLLSWERCRIDSPASYGDWWILRKPAVIDGSSLIGYGQTEDAAIDAAMDAPATPAAAAVDASTAPAMQCAYPHCCDKAGNRCPRMFAGLCSGPRAADPQKVGR